MNKYIVSTILIISLFISVPANCKPTTIIFALSDNVSLPAYGAPGTERSNAPGTFIETTNFICSLVGVKAEYVRYPWNRCLKSMEEGEVHGALIASYKPAREVHGVYPKKNGKIDVSRRFSSSQYCLYVPKASKIRWDGKSFKNLSDIIGTQLGFSISKDLKNLGVEVAEFRTAKQCFDVMKLGRIAGVATHKDTGNIYLAQNKRKFKLISPPLTSKPYYMMLSKQFVKRYPKFAERIWNTVGLVRQSDQVKAIHKKYFKVVLEKEKAIAEAAEVEAAENEKKFVASVKKQRSAGGTRKSRLKKIPLGGLLYVGMRSRTVLLAQKVLRQKALYTGVTDGAFTIDFKDAVLKYQTQNGLRPDGLIGPITWKLLMKELD